MEKKTVIKTISVVAMMVMLVSLLPLNFTAYAMEVSLFSGLSKTNCKFSSAATANYGPEKTFDDDPATFWASGTADAAFTPWIRFDMLSAKYIDQFRIVEYSNNAISGFEISVSNDSNAFALANNTDGTYPSNTYWNKIYQGMTLGKGTEVIINKSEFIDAYKDVGAKARYIQLRILTTTPTRTIPQIATFKAVSIMDEALAVQRDLSNINLGDISNIKGEISVPVSGEFGSTISWSCADNSAISFNGSSMSVNSAASVNNKTATLKATATKGCETAVKDFVVNIAWVEPPCYSNYRKIVYDNFNNATTMNDLINKFGTNISDAGVTPIALEQSTINPLNKYLKVNYTAKTEYAATPYIYPLNAFNLKENRIYMRFKIYRTSYPTNFNLNYVSLDDNNIIIPNTGKLAQQSGVNILNFGFNSSYRPTLSIRGTGSPSIQVEQEKNKWYDIMLELDYTKGTNTGDLIVYVDGVKVVTNGLLVNSTEDLKKVGLVFQLKAEGANTVCIDDIELGSKPLYFNFNGFRHETLGGIESVTAPGKITATVQASNYDTLEDKSFEMCMAVYRNQQLTDITTQSLNIPANTVNQQCSLEVNLLQSDNVSVKVFRWNDFSTIEPLTLSNVITSQVQ